ncbi:putative membrane protein [Halobacteriovorax marinus SJ]|uniref:Membrane protein n=1 Tax=Halobacteriovorax marinus (strain ATCC BAA-682 / DSM 15412 / SJ) TaxID=862908 RepID=E1WZR0_HALMS|nr:biopolymer transporter ExbD [Halobacteriovorax marinus]CBW26246.1 putative membrane protein [Halobacteriovorax marinus SJ]
MRTRREKKEIPKLNLIPILDAVFIFIFFLLMSAQFVEIYEIGSDAPAIATIDTQKSDEKPLNLTLKISNNEIEIKTGVEGTTKSKITKLGEEFDLSKLKKILIDIKLKNIEERSIIISPSKSVNYKQIVKIMDSVTGVGSEFPELSAKSKKGKLVRTKTLFDQIIFETVI